LPDVPQVAAAKPLPEVKIETPPEIETLAPVVEIPWPEMPRVENPAASRPAPRKKPLPAQIPATQTTTPTEETQSPVPPITPPAPTPRLGEILTDARRREYEADFTGSMARARAAVSRASGRRLNATQRETVDRIRVFLRQAEASRAKDLATALQLARRADLLGQDLLTSLR